jgi:hypothetical protein
MQYKRCKRLDEWYVKRICKEAIKYSPSTHEYDEIQDTIFRSRYDLMRATSLHGEYDYMENANFGEIVPSVETDLIIRCINAKIYRTIDDIITFERKARILLNKKQNEEAKLVHDEVLKVYKRNIHNKELWFYGLRDKWQICSHRMIKGARKKIYKRNLNDES